MLVIRFLRTGKKNQPFFRIVVTDKRRPPRGGRFLEILGFFDPLTKRKNLKKERIKYWLSKGAKASATVHNLLVTEKVIEAKKIDVHKKKKSSSTETTGDKKDGVEQELKEEPKDEIKEKVQETKQKELKEEPKDKVKEKVQETKQKESKEEIKDEVKEEIKKAPKKEVKEKLEQGPNENVPQKENKEPKEEVKIQETTEDKPKGILTTL